MENSSTDRSEIVNTWNVRPGIFLFWLFWPFGALVHALSHFKSTTTKMIVWLFCVYFGAAFVIPEDKPGAADSARYSRNLIIMHETPITLSELGESIYDPKTNVVDIYQPLITWIVAMFTDNPKWLFIIFSAVFGFFYVNNLWLVFEQIKRKPSWLSIVFLVAIALTIPIWYVNGVRMYTAAHIFLFGILSYFLKSNKKGLLWLLLSVFVHFSFIFPLAIFITYLVIPKSIILLFVFYIATSLVTELNLVEVRSSLSWMPKVFQPKIEGYTNQGFYELIKESSKTRSWHVVFSSNAERWIIFVWLILIFFKRKVWIEHMPNGKDVLAFTLYYSSWAQLASLIPSGKRFFIISDFFVLFLISMILITQSKQSLASLVAKLTLPFLMFVLLYKVRIGLGFSGVMTFIGNLPTAILSPENIPIVDYIKSLF